MSSRVALISMTMHNYYDTWKDERTVHMDTNAASRAWAKVMTDSIQSVEDGSMGTEFRGVLVCGMFYAWVVPDDSHVREAFGQNYEFIRDVYRDYEYPAWHKCACEIYNQDMALDLAFPLLLLDKLGDYGAGPPPPHSVYA